MIQFVVNLMRSSSRPPLTSTESTVLSHRVVVGGVKRSSDYSYSTVQSFTILTAFKITLHLTHTSRNFRDNLRFNLRHAHAMRFEFVHNRLFTGILLSEGVAHNLVPKG